MILLKKTLFSILVLFILISTQTISTFAEYDNSQNEGISEVNSEKEVNLKKPISTELENELVPTIEDQELSTNVLIIDFETQAKLAWAAGIKVVQEVGHLFTAELMAKALNPPYEAYYGDDTRPSNLIENSSIFKTNVLAANSSKFSKTKIVPISGSSTFTSGELMTSLQSFNYALNVEWNSDRNAYHYYGFITDVYDFKYSTYDASFKGFAVAFANNYATYMLNNGLIKKFDVRIYVNGYY